MRALLILAALGVLSTAAWTVTANAGGSGHGSGHGHAGLGGVGSHMRHGEGFAPHMGNIFPTAWQLRPWIFPGEPEVGPAPPIPPTPGLTLGEPEHVIPGHLVGPVRHPIAHSVERGEAATAQPTAPDTDDSDQAGAAASSPNPTASPSAPRPPGAAGPGRPVTGVSSPGRPGPGQPARLRW